MEKNVILQIVGMGLTFFAGVVMPVIACMILLKKKKDLWILLSFICGGLIYAAFQIGIKMTGLNVLVQYKGFQRFMSEHYLWYCFLVGLVAAILALIGRLLLFFTIYKKKRTYEYALAVGLGYAMTEALYLVGISSITGIVQVINGNAVYATSLTRELYLAAYERILLIIIQTALTVLLVYFIKQKIVGFGIFISLLFSTFLEFLPSFFLYLSTKAMYEIYSREIGLVFVYITLTATGIFGFTVMSYLKRKI